jgi:hypothetical protein
VEGQDWHEHEFGGTHENMKAARWEDVDSFSANGLSCCSSSVTKGSLAGTSKTQWIFTSSNRKQIIHLRCRDIIYSSL